VTLGSNPGMNSDYAIRVQVTPTYLAEHSAPEANRFAFSYTVVIENIGTKSAQLRTRHWVISDANGKVQEVRGPGVVGEQPLLPPGGRFEYTSGTVIATSVGTMHGSYQMLCPDGHSFEAPIPSFVLSIPRTLH
jgi:ApaG protein